MRLTPATKITSIVILSSLLSISLVSSSARAEETGTPLPEASPAPAASPATGASAAASASPTGAAATSGAAPVVVPVVVPLVAPAATPKPAADELKVQVHVEPTDAKAEKSIDAKTDEKLQADLKRNCERHFSGLIQSEVRAACSSAGKDFTRLGKMGRTLVQTRCRMNYGEEPRLVMACLIGTTIAEDLSSGQETFKKKLQLCAETYPVHNEIDEVFLESCLTGIHMPDLMKVDGKERFDACAQITPERSFIGPCAVGLSLAQDTALKVSPTSQNKMCDQYFNLNRFHKGYRACLNARSLAPELPKKYADAIKGCQNVVSEANNDTERAACLVGIAIFRHLERQEDIAKRFQKCGDAKVTYQDRDILACLTAASLMDFTDKSGAESGCKEVFKELKNPSRGDCMKSISLF